MSPASCRTPPCGRLAQGRCRRRNGRASGDRRSLFVATATIGRSRSKRSLSACPSGTWRTINWREGASERLSSRFARLRVRVAHRDYNLTDRRPEEWLLIEWPKGEDQPTKYWLSTLPEGITFRTMVDVTKLRWRIERDYQELKQEVGLGHFEGRGWRGFPRQRHAVHRRLFSS